MSATVWSKFFWSDWANDPALRLCSLAAQGLWMRMLCIAAEANPTGYIAVNGNALDETGLARLTGASESEVADLLVELDRNGVFSRDRHHRIYSRRMVRDAKKSATARKNGKLGGNPTLSNQSGISASDKPPDKAEDKTHKPEARVLVDAKASCPKPARGRISYPEDFEAFWSGYPTDQNMSKKKTFSVWKRLPDEDRRLAIASLPAYQAFCRSRPDYRPKHAEGYLRDGRYEGHAKQAQRSTGRVFVVKDSPQWKAHLVASGKVSMPHTEHAGKRGWWFDREWPDGFDLETMEARERMGMQ